MDKFLEKHTDNKHADKKTYIIRNFVKLVEQFGINRVTLNDVAQKSGLTKSGIYYYFDSKEALFLDTLTLIFEEVGAMIERELSKIEDPTERFFHFIELRTKIFSDTSLTLSFFSQCSIEVMEEMERYIFSSPEMINKIMELNDLEKFYIKNMLKDMWKNDNYSEEFAETVSLFLHTIFEGFMIMMKRFDKSPEQYKAAHQINHAEVPSILAKILTYGLKNINKISEV